MKKPKITKIIVTVITSVLVFVFATTAFAASAVFAEQKVKGGSAQTLVSLTRDNEAGVKCTMSLIFWNGQSGFKYRGYNLDTGNSCTVLKQITGSGSYIAPYAYYCDTVKVKVSIASTDSDDFLRFGGGSAAKE